MTFLPYVECDYCGKKISSTSAEFNDWIKVNMDKGESLRVDRPIGAIQATTPKHFCSNKCIRKAFHEQFPND